MPPKSVTEPGDLYRLGPHNVRLQSLRGIAAVIVLIDHASLVIDSHFSFRTVIEVVFQRHAAVIFFFVLSGFVLSESIRKNGSVGSAGAFLEYLTKRAARLYPALILSVLVASGAAYWMKGQRAPGTSLWFSYFLNLDASPWAILLNSLGLSYSLNGVLWSLQVELAAVLMIPAMVLLIDRINLLANALVFAALAVAVSTGILLNSGNAILYAYCFYLGSLLPYLLKVTAWRSISRAGVVGAMLLGQFVLYWLTPVMMEKMVYDAVLSALVISFVLVRPTSIYARHLSAAPLVKLGDISYSFYALGQVTLAVVSFLIIPHLPFGLVGNLRCTLAVLILIGATLLIALPLSALSYRFIEMPWVAIGRRVAIARADQSS